MLNDRRNSLFQADAGYREMDRHRIIQSKIRYLSPEDSSNLCKIIGKITIQHLSLPQLTLGEMNCLFYGYIFTNTVDVQGVSPFSKEEMALFAEIMSLSFFNKYSDLESFFYYYPKNMKSADAASFEKKLEEFRKIQLRLEKIIGKKDTF